jgi:hypothetical protein
LFNVNVNINVKGEKPHIPQNLRGLDQRIHKDLRIQKYDHLQLVPSGEPKPKPKPKTKPESRLRTDESPGGPALG